MKKQAKIEEGEISEQGVNTVLQSMVNIAMDSDYLETFTATMIFLVALCMKGGAKVDDRDDAADMLNESFVRHWDAMYAGVNLFIGEEGHA